MFENKNKICSKISDYQSFNFQKVMIVKVTCNNCIYLKCCETVKHAKSLKILQRNRCYAELEMNIL